MSETKHRLCIFCRRKEAADSTCPYLARLAHDGGQAANRPALSLSTLTPLAVEDEELLEQLQSQPSQLCQRCADYDILKVFECANPLDTVLHRKLDSYIDYVRHELQYELPLGKLSSLVLEASCQLCRLVYRIMPREAVDPDEDMLRLAPFRSYSRESGWEDIPDEERSNYAIFLALKKPEIEVAVSRSGSGAFHFPIVQLEGIALDSTHTFPGRKWTNSRFIESMVDMTMARQALSHCLTDHPSACKVKPARGLEVISLVDVGKRRVVSYQAGCEYAALSYVWGGVMPTVGALEAHRLPQTIEDAITVTRELGLQYLWVDALCIDQTPDPSPEQAAAKAAQLAMMNLIYASAVITIVAVAGKDADAGLPGISCGLRRPRQIQESIRGCNFFTVPPSFVADRDQSVWNTRAWTFQESFLSKRYLYFSQNQAHFLCPSAGPSESTDVSCNPPGVFKHRGVSFLESLLDTSPVEEQSAIVLDETTASFRAIFASMLFHYTSRRLTNEGDSLNAFLGLITAMERKFFPAGFVHGLPLRQHPELLGWFHDRTATPKRRDMIPSWSWAGWEGTVVFPSRLQGSIIDEEESRTDDMQPDFVSCRGRKLVVKAWLVTLKVITEPFSEAFLPGSTEAYGSIAERNFLHNNTIPTGEHTCLVVQRSRFRKAEDRPERQRIFLIMLDIDGEEATRRTMVTLTPWESSDFMLLKPERKNITLV
ncbi:HET-domain-containing protein [Sarocladium strictum]